MTGYTYWRDDVAIQKKVAIHRAKMLLGFECEPLNLPPKTYNTPHKLDKKKIFLRCTCHLE